MWNKDYFENNTFYFENVWYTRFMNKEQYIKKENKFVKVYRCVSPILYNIIITILMQFPFGILISLLAMEQSGGDSVQYTQIFDVLVFEYSLYILGASLLVTMPFMIVMIYFDKRKIEVWYEWKNFKTSKKKQAILVMILAISFCIALNYLIGLSGIQQLFPGYDEIAEGIFIAPIGIQIIVAGILAPIVEELTFRGIIYRRIRHYLNVKWGMILSSLFFGIYHGNVVQFIYAFLMGLIMVYIYEKYRSIMWPIIFHGVANIVSVCITSTDLGYYMNQSLIGVLIITVGTTVLTVVSFNAIRKDAFQHNDELIGVTDEDNSTFNAIR